jgi:hypothetical protein
MIAPMVVGMMATISSRTPQPWMHYVPWLGQQMLLTDVIGNKAVNPMVFVVVGVVNLALAIGLVRAIAGLLQRERIIFGR